MRYKVEKIWALMAIAALCAGTAASHHAEASFDHSKLLSVTGTVKEFLWSNPHTLIYLEVTQTTGKNEVIVFECGSVSVMTRSGWSRNSAQVGDKVAVDYYPRRDKRPGGMLVTATFENSTTLSWRPSTSL